MISPNEESFFGCIDGEHDYIDIEQYTGFTECKCKKCGKIDYRYPFIAPQNRYLENEEDKTKLLITRTPFILKMENSGEVLEFD